MKDWWYIATAHANKLLCVASNYGGWETFFYGHNFIWPSSDHDSFFWLKSILWESPGENWETITLYKPTQNQQNQKAQWWREQQKTALKKDKTVSWKTRKYRHIWLTINIWGTRYIVYRIFHCHVCAGLILSERQTKDRKRQGQSDLFSYCGDERSFPFGCLTMVIFLD